MNKLFLDTNILIDVLSKRKPHYNDSAEIFELHLVNKVELFISSLTFANINYILSKQIGKSRTISILEYLFDLVQIIPLNREIIQSALKNNKFKDFEDSLQYYSAISMEADIIITRDLKDFKFAKITVMTPNEFLKLN